MRYVLVALSAIFLCAPNSVAQAPTSAPCVGVQQRPDGTWHWGYTIDDACPDGYAVMASKCPGGDRTQPGARVEVHAACCPLPMADLLTDEHVYVESMCPDGHVVTSGSNNLECWECTRKVRCTKINPTKAQLGEALPGAHWGMGGAFWKHRIRVLKTSVPLWLRESLGRKGRAEWDSQGCVGYPFGSLMVGKQGKRCHDLYYRQLLDPETKQPISLWDTCERISGLYSTVPRCESVSQRKGLTEH